MITASSNFVKNSSGNHELMNLRIKCNNSRRRDKKSGSGNGNKNKSKKVKD